MKKRNIVLAMIILASSVTSCSLFAPFSWEKYKTTDYSFSLESPKFNKFVLYSNYGLQAQKITDLDNFMDSGSENILQFVNLVNALNQNTIKIMTSYSIAETRYYATGESQYLEAQNKLLELYYDYIKYQSTFIEKLQKNQVLFNKYFEGMSETEIDEFINETLSNSKTTEYEQQIKNISDEMAELYTSYNNGKISKDEYFNTGISKSIEVFKIGKNIANVFELDDYLDYAYPNKYQREYTKETTDDIIGYVKKYIYPVMKEYRSETLKNLTFSDRATYIESMNYLPFVNTNMYSGDHFTEYAKTMGNEFLSTYNNLWKNGYYCFSSSPNSLGTAYVAELYQNDEKVVYFSKNYQNISSVVHEFGHYLAAKINRGDTNSYPLDINEIYSQANEHLYLAFRENIAKENNENLFEYYKDSFIADQLTSLCACSMVAEVENYISRNYDLNIDVIKQNVRNITSQYEEINDVYWVYPITVQPGYYISYVTSLIPSMNFYVEAQEKGFDEAKSDYIALCKFADFGDQYFGDLEFAHIIQSPLKEESYKSIAQYLDK